MRGDRVSIEQITLARSDGSIKVIYCDPRVPDDRMWIFSHPTQDVRRAFEGAMGYADPRRSR